ncbi:alpha/beta hydrolase family protein [Melioribacteraceae bacterium 4301-Me]|uniref:alpha/beta hydrolase family protein n=1 Tax=Pyranulibacter aquaticus TaxID=3163344 RepID=UPI00359AAB70
MVSKIIKRETINLTAFQKKMVISGWGEEVLNKTTVEKILYMSDGLRISGYLAYPNYNKTKYPCIIWCRGGMGNNGAIDEFNARGMFGTIASWGYVVLASQYRGSAGSEGIDEFGGSDVNDVLNLIPLADELNFADNRSWGIEGWSRGGMMTYLTLTRTNIFKAGVIIGGISNLHCDSNDIALNEYIVKITNGAINSQNFEEECKRRSIINFPEKLPDTTPLLLLHGTADERVNVSNSIELAEKLKQLGKPHNLILLKNGDHFLKSYRKKVNELRKQWFDKYLKAM